jgi:lysophospholipase L1-like esterase
MKRPVRPAPIGPLPRAFVGALAGAALGAGLTIELGGPLTPPEPLDPAVWNVVIPGLDAQVADQVGRGTRRIGNVLALTPHTFSNADVLSPRNPRPLGRLQLVLGAASGPLSVRWEEGPTFSTLTLGTTAWRGAPNGGWIPHEGAYDIEFRDGGAFIGGRMVSRATDPHLELTADLGPVQIRSLTLSGPDGVPWLVEDPVSTWRARAPVAAGAMLGAAAGALALGSGSIAAVLALILPILVLLTGPSAWLAVVERLYLVRADPYVVARVALALSMVPSLFFALARTGAALPAPREVRRGAWWATAAALAGVAIVASRHPIGIWVVPIGAAVLAWPGLLVRAGRFDPRDLLVRVAPGLLAVAVLGWEVGLPIFIAWYLLILAAGARRLLTVAPNAGARDLVLGAVLLLPAGELAARATWLDVAWDADRLDGEEDWADPTPFWEATCGTPPARTVLYVGGSSTGGAYQFAGKPEAFFAGRLHARLCAAGMAVHTLNNGNSGRDSYTVSRSIDTLLTTNHPDLVVAYLGVNDLLTAEHTQTRAQREAARGGQGTHALARLAASSRLFTGISLGLRPARDADAALVPDVPLPDAEINLRRIAAAVVPTGAKLLLLPEHAEPQTAVHLVGYRNLERRLADELDGVEFVDVGEALTPYAGENLLADRNHLSVQGSERLAEVLQPTVTRLLLE